MPKKPPVPSEVRLERKRWAGLLLAARKARGLTQSELASLCSVSAATVGAWETGLAPLPATTLPILAHALGWGPLEESLSALLPQKTEAQ